MADIRGTRPQKAKNFKKSIGSLFSYLIKQLPLIIVIVILSIGTAAISTIIPKRIGDISGVIYMAIRTGHKADTDKIKHMGVALVCIIAAGSLAMFIRSFIMAKVTHKTSKKFRSEINSKIHRLPLSYYDTKSFGDVLSRITNDVDAISQSLNQSVTTLISSVTLIIGVMIMMFISSWQMALIAVVTVPLSMVAVFIVTKKSQKYFTGLQRDVGALSGFIEETYSGHEVVKAYNAVDKTTKNFDIHDENIRRSAFKGQFLSSIMFPVMHFIANLGLVAVCVFGGVMIAGGKGGIELKDIIAFMMYVRLFANSLPQLAQVASSMQTTAAAAERIFEFLDEKEVENEENKLPAEIDVQGKVEFRNVCFGYSPEKQIINDFSMVARPGQKIAIVGPTGAGKTTIVNLLMRFYEIDGGEILIDGVSTRDMTRVQLHNLFAMVLQDTWLFNGTIKENIIYSKANISNEDVYRACEDTGIGHIIKSLPSSYEMQIDENSNLSSGQKQLITIARAIIKDAPMLILDEATSAVDTRTEIMIQQAMDKLTKGRTSFIIAHRLSTIKNADLILVMSEGGIVEQGNHAELMQIGGHYSNLYNSQFQE